MSLFINVFGQVKLINLAIKIQPISYMIVQFDMIANSASVSSIDYIVTSLFEILPHVCLKYRHISVCNNKFLKLLQKSNLLYSELTVFFLITINSLLNVLICVFM